MEQGLKPSISPMAMVKSGGRHAVTHYRVQRTFGPQEKPLAARVACRHALEKAYGEFAAGQGQKTFKVFQDQKTGFVPLSSLGGFR